MASAWPVDRDVHCQEKERDVTPRHAMDHEPVVMRRSSIIWNTMTYL
ncbi:MAG: hypothetical protein ACP5J5_02970 [Dissulfurimicrobium sp.]